MKKLLTVFLSLVLLCVLVPAAVATEVTSDTTWYGDGSATTFTITDEADLRGLAELVNNGNTFAGKTVTLSADIDLANKAWTPIGTNGDTAGFQGVFDGQNHTIRNLYIDQSTPKYQAAGLFGSARNGEIKNLTIDGVSIVSICSGAASTNGTAAVLGSAQFAETVTNVHVKNATITSNRYAAGIVGYFAGTVQNCSVENVTITATPNDTTGNGDYDNGDKVGGIVGYCNGAVTLTNNTVKGENAITAYRDIGGIVGCINGAVAFAGNTVEGTVSITVDQTTNSYGDKVANAGVVFGRDTASTPNATAPTTTVTASTNVTIDGSAACVASGANRMDYATLAEAVAAAQSGDTITLYDGTHTMPNQVVNKNITIVGSEDAVIEMFTAVNATGSTIHFSGVTAKFDNDNYEGLQHSTKVTYTDCTVEGTQFLYAPEVTFTDCTFSVSGDAYAVWTYGASRVDFTGCTFNTEGKAILVYTEVAHTAEIHVTECTFNATASRSKAAVEIGQSANGNAYYTLNITDSTADANFIANHSTSNLWGNKNDIPGRDMAVVVDDALVYGAVAKIGETGYRTLQAAVDAAVVDQTIVILCAFDENNVEVASDDSITVDLNGKTVDVDIMNYGKLTVKNGTINNTNSARSAVENNGAEATLTVENLNITSACHALRIDGGKATVKSGSYATVGQNTVYAVNISGGATVTIVDGTFMGARETGTAENTAALHIRDTSSVTVMNGNFSGGSVLGTLQCKDTATISITGGTYDEDPTAYLAEGFEAIGKNGTWTANETEEHKVQNGEYNAAYLWMWIMMQNQEFTVTASPAVGGTVTVADGAVAKRGEDKTCTVIPADGYVIADVLVDGVSVGAVANYTFNDITANHTITAVFAKAPFENPYSDVNEATPYYESILFVTENGLMQGDLASFFPNDGLHRGMLVTILWRMENSPAATKPANFTDVKSDDYFAAAVAWAAESGIVLGNGDGTFTPETAITHEQLCAILYRYAKYKGFDTSVTADVTAYETSDWATKAVAWAAENGLLDEIVESGYTPLAASTRAEAANILSYFFISFLKK